MRFEYDRDPCFVTTTKGDRCQNLSMYKWVNGWVCTRHWNILQAREAELRPVEKFGAGNGTALI